MPNLDEVLDALLAEEEEIQFVEFSNATGIAIGRRLLSIAEEEGLPIAIDVTRHGQQLFHASLPGATLDNDVWIHRKNRVVNHFFHSSFYMGMRYKSQGSTIEEKSLLPERKYAPHGGAFPILVRNVGVIGIVTVSGLPQEDDHKLVVRVLRDFITNRE